MSLLGHMALLKLSPQPHFPLMKPALLPSGLCLPSERKGVAARTCPCLPCRRPGRSPTPGSLTQPPRTPSNLALPSPAVRAGMAAKTSAAEHAPWRAAAAAPAGSEPQKCPVLAPRAMSHTCAHLSPWDGITGPRSSREFGAELKMTPQAQGGSNKSQSSSAAPEEQGIRQVCPVLTFSVLPARLELGGCSAAHLQ